MSFSGKGGPVTEMYRDEILLEEGVKHQTCQLTQPETKQAHVQVEG